MTFAAAVQSCLSKYAVFSGRAPRSEFWWFYLFTVLVSVAAVLIGGMTVSGTMSGPGGEDWYFYTYQGWLANLVHLALLLPSLAVSVRRLHDAGHSGWWLLIAFVPFGIFVLLFWWLQPSAPGANAHGGPPLLTAG